MKKRVWSKFEPGTTAVVVGEPDVRGLSPAYIASPAYEEQFHGQVTASINLDEWSDSEVVPVPDTVLSNSWVVLYGDVDEPQYHIASTEKDAAVWAAKTPGAWGYAPVVIGKVMTPA